MEPVGQDWVVVIDFGAQYSQLIARRVRECRVFCELVPHTADLEQILARKPRGVILSGGPASVYGPDAPRIDPWVFEAGVPVLGICYGMQLMAHLLGGQVRPTERREYGRAMLSIEDGAGIFAGVGERRGRGLFTPVWMSHGDRVESPPPGFFAIASTENSPVAAMRDATGRLWAVQFHPEVAHTPEGRRILENFLVGVCGCAPNWTMENFIETATAAIREQIGPGRAVCALSGGVDSATAAALVDQAIGDRLYAIFVDHGLMRHGEPEQVAEAFGSRFGDRFIAVDARDRFLSRLRGISEPEQKRKIIGEEFIRVFEEEARRIGDVRYLVQGTLYPDVVESGTQSAAVIKSHHNVGGLPETMALDLIEPLRQLFKDEVRRLGAALGLPQELVWRQPFPGPGLAIRVIGPVDPERVERVRQADRVVVEEIRRAGLEREVWQAFAVLTDTRSVGVMGDGRTYGDVVAVRAVGSTDGMTADWYRLPAGVLERIASRIMNEVPGVNRVVYDISSKPPATIEWE
ncbi:MAG TPA: glutamine-hydrolyzing GMP synthase [Limnochordia bacterium]